jgi:hypothetical protein
MSTDWRCAGCGVAAPDKLSPCECPTNAVYAGVGKERRCEWKRPHVEDVVAGMHELLTTLRPADRTKAVRMLASDLRNATVST